MLFKSISGVVCVLQSNKGIRNMQKNENKISVIIPTFNRIESIIPIISYINQYKGELFSFEIHDSSSNLDILNLIKEKNIENKIKYYHYKPEIDVDIKTVNAILKCNSEYVWLLGDGLIVDFDTIELNLRDIFFESFSIIEVIPRKKKHPIRCSVVNDCGLFFKDHFSHITFWGATIIRKELFVNFFNKVDDTNIYVTSMRWWIAQIVFTYLNQETLNLENNICCFFKTASIFNNPNKKDHWWTTDEKYYQWAITMLNKCVFSLPEMYNPFKKSAVKNFRKDKLMTIKYFIKMRSINMLNIDLTRKYKNDIKYVSGFYWKMVLISCLPVHFCNLINQIYQSMKDYYQRVFID